MFRRTFVKGLILTPFPAYATTKSNITQPSQTSVLQGREFFLEIGYTLVQFTGKVSVATTVNGQLPAPTLVWDEGEIVTLHVTNHLKTTSSIHWHGIILPTSMDGVPGLSFDGIAPGETFTYRFKVQQHGTYWYHSHSNFQEQTGVYGAIVIRPKKKEPFNYDRDYVVVLSDWSDEKPMTIYSKLKMMSSYYNYSQRTVGNFMDEVKEKGFMTASSDRKMWNEMRMSDRDISDVSGATYTYLMNGKNPTTHFKALFEKGEKIRLRFVNAAAMTFFDVRIPELTMQVVAADGNHVLPVNIEEFRIGVAETYDVIVEPKKHQAYAIFAQSIDRSGYTLGSLTPNTSMLATPPPMDPKPILTHADMGMAMDEMDHDGGMKCGAGMSMPSKKNMKKSKYAHMESQHYPITPLPMAEGVQIDMRATSPQYRLDDPGVGLRNNGRKVLSYADLKNRYSTRNAKKPDREIILHLTGNMERFMWSINGIKYADAEPLAFAYGERIRITFINDTMMNHPMHLHGMWSDVETGDDAHLVRKHTVIVQPGAKISYRVTVDAKGRWAFHCHMLYHMAGMFREVHVV
ncbi:MAG TPA: copper resistance system multicopper oxidase [Sulfurovum sp.]|jgi:CopA family copper-resistance protein|nr:MAG: copper resistance protein CopA [Sulfurovum sp. 35-42-20]OYZ26160.1 MAG: copper resistance protein CopA [Sulfurovum sp. 16-42-52]OYZ48011.1 MAG: copper resistance protein CopA [Sulfurovum sp. 24-42-9]OZA46198.1 MAG: copper resistance protein CopA [Sulfurovum sp. 17-42-90]OZA61389.1 MAG: copper resistance protein CopA [Sulfurovum sp. 39-42-12]HQR74715.1 copper resistance system multicopper oxidase [Sulfurovum sp.]